MALGTVGAAALAGALFVGYERAPSASDVTSIARPIVVPATTTEPPTLTSTMPPYDRDEWGGWADEDRDGCDTRAEVLMRDLAGETVRDEAHGGCLVLAGRYRDPYTGIRGEADATVLDVDHVVALADAHRSGGWKWTTAQKLSFANDHANLLAANNVVNRSKGDKGPDQWSPPLPAAACRYARVYEATKLHWDLDITPAQRTALDRDLATC